MFEKHIKGDPLPKVLSFDKELDQFTDQDFLMSRGQLENLRNRKELLYSAVERRVNRICQNNPNIFSLLKKQVASSGEVEDDVSDLYEDSLKSIAEEIGYDKLISDVPEDVLAILLKPLSKEMREAMYVQRNKVSVAQLLEVAIKWQERVQYAFHVSPNKINGQEIKGPVYFSTDIKQLFRAPKNRYIYAFKLPIDSKGIQWNSNVDVFGHLKGNVIFEDMYPLVDKNKKDPLYLQKALSEIGANFKDDYYADSDRVRAHMDD